MEILLYICFFFCGWVCHSLASYIMSLGYSVILLRNILRDVVFLVSRVIDVVYIIHEMKIIHLEGMNLSEKQIDNNKKLHNIQLNNVKKDIVDSIIRNFPKNFNHIIKFHDWDSMIGWMNKELKINKEAK